MTKVLDGMCDAARTAGPGAMVSWYLMASFAYYHCDCPILSDGYYDALCASLDEAWDQIEHQHKAKIDRGALQAGSGYTMKVEDYPLLTRYALDTLLKQYMGTAVDPVHLIPTALKHVPGTLGNPSPGIKKLKFVIRKPQPVPPAPSPVTVTPVAGAMKRIIRIVKRK